VSGGNVEAEPDTEADAEAKAEAEAEAEAEERLARELLWRWPSGVRSELASGRPGAVADPRPPLRHTHTHSGRRQTGLLLAP